MHHYLTFFRLIISPAVFFLIKKNFNKIALFLSLCAIISDILDGFLARFLKKESSFGAIFDVIADKTFVYCAILGFLLKKKTPISIPSIFDDLGFSRYVYCFKLFSKKK